MTKAEKRKLDAQLALALGCKHICDALYDYWVFPGESKGNLPHFSSTWQGIGLVAERMQQLGWHYSLEDIGDVYKAVFHKWDAEPFNSYAARDIEAPQAIAKAALKAREAETKALAALGKEGDE